MNIKIFSIAILASLLCLSCTDTNLETTAQSNKTQTNGTLHTYDVEIEAGTFNPSSRAALTRMAMPYKITEENLQGETVLYPKLDIPDKKTMPSLLVLCQKIENAKTHQFEVTKRITVQANWKVKKNGTETDFLLDKLSIYEDLKQGQWYLMAFMGGGEVSGEQLNVNLSTTANLIKKDQAYTASCPYATTWRRVVVDGGKLKLQNENNRMIFKPQGVFMMIDAESRMSLNTKLAREVQLESNAFCSRGTYTFDINKIKTQTIADNADLASDYWTPNDADKVPNSYQTHIKYNGQLYTTNITLNYQAGSPDGTVTSDKTELNKFMYFNAASASTDAKGERHVTTKPTKQFLLCLMPVDYKKTATNNSGVTTEALFYGKVYIEESKRTHYTCDQLTYQYDPSTWKPYMENRYLLGSFSNNLAKGSCYRMRLRIVRPMLPIERLWAYRQGTKYIGVGPQNRMKDTNRGDAEKFAEGNKTETQDGGYPGLDKKQYRLPKFSELMPIFNNCTEQLRTKTPLGGVNGYTIASEYGYALAIGSFGNWVNINGKQRKFDNWFCLQNNSTDLYGIMYIKPFGGGGPTTGNYKVAVKMSFGSPDRYHGGVADIYVYYLGPNYNLSNAVSGYYCCHDQFWSNLTDKDYINRRFPYNVNYWLNDKTNIHGGGETRSTMNQFSLSGQSPNASNESSGWENKYFLPWLKEPAWQ